MLMDKLSVATIFISYAREDGRNLALQLRDDLNTAGHQAWLDTSEIQGGADWARHIEDAIERCDMLLALLSAASYNSEYCRAEQMRAQRKGKRIIPVLVQPDAERPIYLEHLNYFDFSNNAIYDAKLYVLLGDIAGRPVGTVGHPSKPAAFIPAEQPHSAFPALDEKPDAEGFSKHLEQLRGETWLGGRYWWPYFLYHAVDVQSAVEVLQSGKLSATQDDITSDRWKDFVHLDFRPRTPNLWRKEGIRPANKRQSGQIQMPVYLMFDFDAIIRRADSRFSEGDIYRLRKSSKKASDFRKLPFEQIYHDSWFAAEERDEIMLRRQAVVLVPDHLGLEHLRHVWCRSAAERDTLLTLLPSAAKWQDKITARTDFNLFNRKWAYVEEAELQADHIKLRFNPCDDDCGTFALRVEAKETNRRTHTWREADFVPGEGYQLDVSALNPERGYTLRVYLDDTLAYAGRYTPPV
jgi:hypothetical protein